METFAYDPHKQNTQALNWKACQPKPCHEAVETPCKEKASDFPFTGFSLYEPCWLVSEIRAWTILGSRMASEGRKPWLRLFPRPSRKLCGMKRTAVTDGFSKEERVSVEIHHGSKWGHGPRASELAHLLQMGRGIFDTFWYLFENWFLNQMKHFKHLLGSGLSNRLKQQPSRFTSGVFRSDTWTGFHLVWAKYLEIM